MVVEKLALLWRRRQPRSRCAASRTVARCCRPHGGQQPITGLKLEDPLVGDEGRGRQPQELLSGGSRASRWAARSSLAYLQRCAAVLRGGPHGQPPLPSPRRASPRAAATPVSPPRPSGAGLRPPSPAGQPRRTRRSAGWLGAQGLPCPGARWEPLLRGAHGWSRR